ncbi:SCO family protein [Coralloluteibacterium thermophilus]|uniref:SCO family protein n=1 Tax=Coralloluteibacterium thermophilum TaxID=2707049 RepID=A0ABV9NJE2_9GAMM
MFNRTTLIVLVAALAAGLGLWLAQRSAGPALPELETVRLFPQARALPPFALDRGEDAPPLTNADLQGRWSLVFIGFTHCPDVCPTTLAQLAQAQRAWRDMPEETRPQVVFVSVDPERDSPARTVEYARYFDPDTLAATSDPDALREFVQSLGMVFMKVPVDGGAEGDYTIDHSSTLSVIDPQGRMTGLVRPEPPDGPGSGTPAFDPQAIARDMRVLAGMTGP